MICLLGLGSLDGLELVPEALVARAQFNGFLDVNQGAFEIFGRFFGLSTQEESFGRFAVDVERLSGLAEGRREISKLV